METILSRIEKIASLEGIKIGAFEKSIGASKGVLSRALKQNTDIQAKWLQRVVENYPQYSARWLLTGKGDVMRPCGRGDSVLCVGDPVATYSVATPPVVSSDVAGSPEDLVPVIPRYICEEPGVDVYRYIQTNDVAMSPRVPQFPTCAAYYMVYGDEMLPHFMPGDKLAVSPYALGKERKLLDGRSYLIDTVDNGLLLRTLYKGDGGFRAVAANSVYSEEFLEAGDIYRIFRILGLIRTNV